MGTKATPHSLNTFREIRELSTKAHLLSGIEGLLGWDQETVMPAKASPIRALQRSYLAELSHTIYTSTEYENLLTSLVDIETGEVIAIDLDEPEQACLREWARDFRRQKKLPNAFVKEFAETCSIAMHKWEEAKHENSFSMFEPHLKHIVDLVRKKADYIGFQEHPYDALVDEFEPGYTTKELDGVFSQLSLSIPRLVAEITRRNKSEDKTSPQLTLEEQARLASHVLSVVGFDTSCGRVDLSCHPFSSSYHPTDSRLTIRNTPQPISQTILVTLHEFGHCLYDMNLPVEYYGTPLCEAVSYGIHESQSRTWETKIGGSLCFWRYIAPQLTKLFPACSTNTAEDFFSEITHVEPSFIRTDADEVTYPLHISLRFRIEKELIEGSLSTRDLPERWNSEMHTLLSITPPRDDLGCLQDVHWSMGAFGYFPSYTLGDMFSAALFEQFESENPNWTKLVEKGKFSFIRDWYKKNIHCHGKRFSSKDLIERVTKKPVSSEPYVNYLSKKYNPSPFM